MIYVYPWCLYLFIGFVILLYNSQKYEVYMMTSIWYFMAWPLIIVVHLIFRIIDRIEEEEVT